jgi:hypothetical protein
MVARPMFDCPAQVGPHDWECSNCCTQQDSASPPWHAENGSQVCAGCITSRFQHALDSPTEWPSRWGSVNLDVEHYRQILSDDLYNAYVAKAAAFALTQPSEPALPDGCTWGVQVQWCPGCKKIGGLVDGCNHIVCEACHTNFCFVCRIEARDHSGHWRKGGCPRLGNPDSSRAIYDPEPVNDPPFDEARAEEDARLVSSMLNWNMAMQTSDLATQNVLRRFLDRDNRPRIRSRDIRTAIAAMGNNHALTGIRDDDWYPLQAVIARRLENRLLLGTLLTIRDTPSPRNPRGDFPETNIFARTAPLSGLLRQPIAREFNMGVPESRNAAFNWIVAYLHDNSVPRVFGDPHQANSAILHGIAPHIVTEQVVVVFELQHPSFRAEPLTGTSMILTIQGDVFAGWDARNVTVEGLAHTFRQLLIDVAQE